jgi:hypothetical protein
MSQSQTIQLAPDLQICRILNGMWQVAGGHGQINSDSAISEMLEHHRSGFLHMGHGRYLLTGRGVSWYIQKSTR